ncbi:hypothetical protein LCI18_003853 [Fusarium solani-melongenae]|uniref:Uncharacterized protein n=1 Tax=Fusarium solani subsp. cucurbitae TaxID=2747967 RepID=A0ACD3YV96_FUSSC|nr:hypothetical protein LCI18_003853 [Fusarium solani-melongenae]
MESPQTHPQPNQQNTHTQHDESILAWDEARPVSPLESEMKPSVLGFVPPPIPPDSDKPRSKNSISKACTRFYDSWEAFLLRPWKMCILLFTGTIFAISHHLFYLRLHGREGDAQSLMFRYGTIIAFCAKASFGTAVAMAFQQRAWLIVRRKTARLDTVDSIFTANTEFISLLDWRAVKRAKVSTCLALYCWLTPLVVILTSETLSTVPSVLTVATSCSSVRTLNFSNEETNNYAYPTIINNRPGRSISLWNTTSGSGKLRSDEGFTKDKFNYFTGPTVLTEFVLARTIYQRQAVVRENAGSEVCSEGWNCSYIINFIGPGYKCQQLASGVGSKVKKLSGSEAPFDISMIAPQGNYTYLAETDRGEYGMEQIINSSFSGMPLFDPPYPKNMGAFRTEPIIWIGYVTVNDTSLPQPIFRNASDWNEAYKPVIFGCEHYEVNYTVRFNYTRAEQSHKVIGRKFLNKVVDTTYLPNQRDPDKRLKDHTVATPEQNYVLPNDLHRYRRVAAYHTLGSGLRRYLDGSLRTGEGYQMTDSKARDTLLLTQPYLLPTHNLPKAIQSMYEDLLISLLSEPDFIVVSWASNGKPSGYASGGPETEYPCYRTRLTTAFRYDWLQLIVVYLVSFVLASVGVLLGFQAAREEGLMRDMKPSSIIEATRAPSLNELGPGGELDKNKVKVGYGLVQQHAGESVRSFGLEGGVIQQPARS